MAWAQCLTAGRVDELMVEASGNGNDENGEREGARGSQGSRDQLRPSQLLFNPTGAGGVGRNQAGRRAGRRAGGQRDFAMWSSTD